MTDLETTIKNGEDFIAHYGIPGMKWGRRRTKAQIAKAKASREPASADAVKAAQLKKKAKKSGVKSLSNQELKDLNERINLEQNFSNLKTKERERSQKRIKEILSVVKTVGEAQKQAEQFAKSDLGQKFRSVVKEKAKSAFS